MFASGDYNHSYLQAELLEKEEKHFKRRGFEAFEGTATSGILCHVEDWHGFAEIYDLAFMALIYWQFFQCNAATLFSRCQIWVVVSMLPVTRPHTHPSPSTPG